MILSKKSKMTLLIVLSALLALVAAAHFTARDWRSAPRDSVGISPLPADHPDAIVQVYAARAINWRGWFAVHTWIAAKEKNASTYKVYHVMGWQLRRTGKSISIQDDIPDRFWFGARPYLVDSISGAKAEAAIPKIVAAADSYAYPQAYRAWPGPNSNTFVSHIIRNVPELGVELPPNAIGKDWLDKGEYFAKTESGTGYQLSLLGVLGVALGIGEGIEINILGLNFGIDFMRPALKLPVIGRLGMKDAPVSD